ncbi:MAG: hypothetical protein [Caudoviricetes sp.]|nr:MAG: hypothetical protein [Caudoviricetes sp.]
MEITTAIKKLKREFFETIYYRFNNSSRQDRYEDIRENLGEDYSGKEWIHKRQRKWKRQELNDFAQSVIHYDRRLIRLQRRLDINIKVVENVKTFRYLQ